MSDLNDIMVFVRVARERSFTRAAAVLGMPKSTVSERVARLEAQLGVRLLERTTRTLRLTESGSEYYARVERVFAELEEAETTVTAAHNTPRGVLRIGSPTLFAHIFLSDVIADYMKAFPDVQVELVLADRTFDVLEEELDVAIHVLGQMDAQIIARKLGVGERFCVASPEYLAARGVPKTPADLSSHSCIANGPTRSVTWTFERERQTRAMSIVARYCITSIMQVHHAALSGLGVTILPSLQAAPDIESGRLVRVLAEWSVPDTVVHLVYPSHRHLSARVRAFVDFVVERLPTLPERLFGPQTTR